MLNNFFDKIKEIRGKTKYKSLNYYAKSLNYPQNIPHGLYYQTKTFLSTFYDREFQTNLEIEYYHNLYKYEALLSNLIHAQNKSNFYQNSLKNFDFIQLEQELEAFRNSKSSKTNIKILKKKISDLLFDLPCTLPENIVENPERFLAVKQDEIDSIISVETSGTNGIKRIYSTENDLNSTFEFFFYGMQHILGKNNRVAVLFSSERIGTVGQLMQRAMNTLKIECKVFAFTDDFDKLIEELLIFNPSCLIGIPWHILKLSDHAKNTDLKKTIKSILLSADTISSSLKEQIKTNLKCKVYEHYGLTEFGLGAAVSSQEDDLANKLVIRSLDLLVEIIDENGKPVSDNTWGEIVISSLSREAMPLIRYRTGDLGRKITEQNFENDFFDHLEMGGRRSQSFEYNNKLIRLHDLQYFIHKKGQIIDFEICLYSDTKNDKRVLLLGLEFSSDTSIYLKHNTIAWIEHYLEEILKLKPFDYDEYLKKSKKNVFFKFMKLKKFQRLFKKNKISPKKKIEIREGDFLNFAKKNICRGNYENTL